jgi:hypothetical protein
VLQGKKKEGNAAKYITRTKAVSYLQISLAVFRSPFRSPCLYSQPMINL